MADPHDLLEVAVEAARAAGALLLEGQESADRAADAETKTSGTDMVTEMDRASEALVARIILEARPDDAFLGEEGTSGVGTTGVRWVVDPLDGTTNYLYGFPAWAVSVAAEVDGRMAAGAVFDPTHDQMFTAALGGGARCGSRPLRVEGAAELATALVVLARALRAHRVARADPSARDVSPAQALVTRIGYGAGEAVADGRYAQAWELPREHRRTQRSMEAPDERFAALIGAREAVLACEDLVLRARADLDAGIIIGAATKAETLWS